MISKTELRLLKIFLADLTRSYSIRELSRTAKVIYPQAHRAVQSLLKKELLVKEQKGKNWVLFINLRGDTDFFIAAEMERKNDILQKHPSLKILLHDLENLSHLQVLCILFGSFAAEEAQKNSDIDLLFVIPETYSYTLFEKAVKNTLTQSHLDLQITTEKGLLEMWQHPLQLNVGNEILKKHILLRGAEAFFLLRKRHYWG